MRVSLALHSPIRPWPKIHAPKSRFRRKEGKGVLVLKMVEWAICTKTYPPKVRIQYPPFSNVYPSGRKKQRT